MVFALELGVKHEKSSSPPYHSITLAFCDSRLESRQEAGSREIYYSLFPLACGLFL
jgi:hypothetical protein